MSTNPYTSWPLWNFFSLHFQNISGLKDNLSTLRAIEGTFILSTNTFLTSVSNNLVVYDFMKDSIEKLSTFSGPITVITGPINLQMMLKSKALEPNALVIIKGLPPTKAEEKGDIIPIIGTADKMNLIIQAMTAALKNIPYDIRSHLSEDENSKIKELLERPIYTSISIARIVKSYESCSVTKVDSVNLVNAISKKIALFMSGKQKSENYNINLEKGTLASTKSDKSIMEFRVQLNSSAPINIKFSFPSDITQTKKESLINMLKTNFNAVEVHTPSDDERRSTQLRPVRINSNSISSIFGAPTEFSAYVAKVNNMERPESINVSASLADLTSRDMGEEEEEESLYEND
jgi:hypothetical protein